MKNTLTILLVCGSVFAFAGKSEKCCKKKKTACTTAATSDSAFTLKNSLDTVSYFIGAQIGNDMVKNGAADVNADALHKGLIDALTGQKALVDPQVAIAYAQAYFTEKQQQKAAEEAAKVKKFFDDNAKNRAIKTTASGLQYEVIKDSIGPKPLPTDVVSVHYTGTLTDGTIFDSSEGGEPAKFPLNRVIPGWTEGVQLMSVGAKYKFYIPGNLAYGEQGVPQAGIGPNETLIFVVELLSIEKPAPPAPQVPQAPSNFKIEGQ